ncbi:YSC84-related protein [Shewanella algae]|uniref:lipid-binding SYLF domain-containing protein n=1 Tax=Shewanella algae TaxID=38313 RepID=UPI000D1310D9|nr:lipid-binding SYLF domain-containing protein [Shewanella algae]MBO2555013.1 lipid-binding SYLF domain-containing protein [Shewanella algae]MBO2571947.1 lipid-binding SYLF domain-containing protein [Shewanella algae]MBO2614544.1 lipid-binding SYLF domain-containing protein [Shewanella algae]MBO2618660.1 lipid-binding SYLF domain-containing protein [Shewanella algae]MDV2963715.1 lipid-binding SYLF domain-containing protein [Shewanella algae]
MKAISSTLFALLTLASSLLLIPTASANDSYSSAIATFKQASETHKFFDSAYGYAIFPTVGKGGLGIGAAYGKGRVYRGGVYTGESSMTQVSIGFQIGGQAYSEIIFFKDEQAYRDFTSGSFEFGAQASAVAINAGANAQAGTTGNSAGAGQSGGSQAAKASYINGMAVFTAAKGGLMVEAALAGQSFTFEAQ